MRSSAGKPEKVTVVLQKVQLIMDLADGEGGRSGESEFMISLAFMQYKEDQNKGYSIKYQPTVT